MAFSLVCGTGLIDIVDVMQLLMASKSMHTALSRLTAVYSWTRRGGSFVEGLLGTFHELKLLHINTEALVLADLETLLQTTNISLLRLLNVRASRRPNKNNRSFSCGHLKQLAVSGSTLLVVDAVDRCDGGRLQALMVTDNMYVTSSHIARMLTATQALTSLRLANLPALREVLLHAGLLKSLKTLSLTHCRFLGRIEVPAAWTALQSCDLSCTSMNVDAVAALVGASPRLLRLDVRAGIALRGTLVLRSPSLRRVDLRLCAHLGALVLACPLLEAVDVRGCFSLCSLRVASTCPLAHLDLAMLTRLAALDVADNCPALRHLDLSGCVALPSHHWAHPAVLSTSMTDHALGEVDNDDDNDDDGGGGESLSDAVNALAIHASPSFEARKPAPRLTFAAKHVPNRRNKSRRSASL